VSRPRFLFGIKMLPPCQRPRSISYWYQEHMTKHYFFLRKLTETLCIRGWGFQTNIRRWIKQATSQDETTLAIGREEICEPCGWKTGNSFRVELREYHGQQMGGEATWNEKNWRLSVCLSVCLFEIWKIAK